MKSYSGNLVNRTIKILQDRQDDLLVAHDLTEISLTHPREEVPEGKYATPH